ncbi:MAG: type II secretion system F family protein [Actinobacteria bacterium]|nr:type II secretion system F family protein [Actinomycetota bacterium]
MTPHLRRPAALFLAAIAGLLGASPVLAQTATPPTLVIRSVDTTELPTVKATVQYEGATAPGPSDFTVRDGGRIVSGVVAKRIDETPTPIGVVLVIDTSGSMRERGRLDGAKAAVREFVAHRSATEQIAVVAFSDSARVVHSFTADDGAAAAVDALGASGETALWDALALGVGLFGDRPELQPNLVVLSDGRDTVSTRTAAAVRSAAATAHVVVHAVGINGGGLDSGGLAGLAAATGGHSYFADAASGVTGLFAEVRNQLTQQYELSWKSASSGTVDLHVSVKGAEASGRAAAGAVSQGKQAQPKVVPPGRLAPIGNFGRLLAILGAVAAVGCLVLGLAGMGNGSNPILERIGSYGTEATEAPDVQDGPRSQVSSSLLQRAVDATERAAEQRGVLAWVEAKLEAARLPIRAAEASFFTAVFALLAGVAALALKGPIFGLVALVLGLAIPTELAVFLAYRQRRRFVKQLPQMLQLLSSSLRAGYALLQGVEAVSREIGDPMGAELRRVMAEARLGRPLELALDDAATRMNSADFAWAVMAIGIQRDVGGNLSELLDTVAETMVARNRLKNEVKALTAEGRMSAMVLGVMPPGLAGAMAVISPGYLNPLFKESIGHIMIGACLVMMGLGFAWMRKIIEIKV